jgi:hypothetical protein
VPSTLRRLPGCTQRAHRIVAEARRLGLINIRIERANSSSRLAAEFNGEPISVPLELMLADRSDPPQALLQFHRQLRKLLSRRY